MSLQEWAKNEVEIACKRENPDRKEGEFDYGCACYESALKAFESLCEDGHSGMSIGFTKQILNRLINGKPLTPIEDTEEMWKRSWTDEKGKHYQCSRMSSLFKTVTPNGEIKYSDINRCYCVNRNHPNYGYHNGFIRSIYDAMYPIAMPYAPADKPDKIVCDELLTDPKNGDYDTKAIIYIEKPDGKKVKINRYFKESEESFKEISWLEYQIRRYKDWRRRKWLGNDEERHS